MSESTSTAAADLRGASEHRPFASRALWIQYFVAIATLAVVAAPLVAVLYPSFLDRPLYDEGGVLTLQNYARLFRDSDFYGVLWNSVYLALLTTIVACVLGVGLALLLERTSLPLRGFLRSLAIWPAYVSHLVIAFAWFMMYGPSGYITLLAERMLGEAPWDLYTIPGMAVVAGTAQASLVYLFCAGSASLADSSLEDAARSVGARPARVLFSISLPLMRPAIIYSALLNFVGSLEMLSVPLVFGRPVGLDFFTTYLYREAINPARPDYGLLGAAAAFLLAIIAVLLILQGLLLKRAGRFVTLKGKATRPKLADLGRLRWLATAAVLAFLTATLLIPLAGIVLRSFTSFLTPLVAPWELLTLEHYALLFEYDAYIRSITNSLIVSSVGAAVGVLLVAMIALVVHRSEFRFGRQLELIALSPRAVPGVVAGIGFFWATLIFGLLGPLQGTLWILMIAFIMRNIPTAYGAISPALLQISGDLDRSARACGADWWQTCRRIIIPVLKPAMFSAYVLLFVAFMKEYASAAFIYAPGSEIIGTTMLSFWLNGDSGPVAALSVIQLLLTAVFVAVAARFLRSRH